MHDIQITTQANFEVAYHRAIHTAQTAVRLQGLGLSKAATVTRKLALDYARAMDKYRGAKVRRHAAEWAEIIN